MTWETVPLGSIADLRAGVTFPPALQGRTSGEYPFAKVGDIGEASRTGGGDLSAARNFVEDEDLRVLRAIPVPALSTLFAKIGESVRLNARAYNRVPVLIDNNAMAAIPRTEVDPRFLFRFLQSIDLGLIASTTSVPSLRKSDLVRWPVPLPPLPEQRRIAATLDEADALRGMEARANAAQVEAGEAAFRALEDKLGTGSTVPLDVLADVSSGITKGRRVPDGPLITTDYMTVANVQDRRLDLATVKQMDVSAREIERFRLVHGDLLLTEGGDPDKLGRGVVWSDQLPAAIHQNHVFRVRLRNPVQSPIWLNWEIGSKYGKRYFLRAAKQTTGIATINATQLRAFPVRVPPPAAVYRFLAELSEVQRVRSIAARRASALDSLFTSLQHRAFRGEL